ncbi:hypothetical protein [Pelagicoccus mobilis]|uniref:Uncharacterized protein n=1 Tax=Pelagicoccus mobilis TaxID=415221 RepID=A0A934S1I2_9BACT|nr:hypothetical protein [Pelagicoccus mobilis]MBK1880198.1 hypothetical protein [Pelagicoccus mobilis]
MNKQVFIERLNLYLDGELSAEESEELLAEVRENPEFHRIYVQYCQLFNACSKLGEKFVETKPASQWRQKVYAIGGMAAAGALLFMAARNLTPLIGGQADQLSQSVPMMEPANGIESEPLLVMDVNELEGQRLSFGDGVVPVAFDIEKAFDRGDQPLNFGSDSNVSFARFTVDSSKKEEKVWAKKEFKFGEAVRSSTFEHESLSGGEGDNRIFSVRALGSALDEDDASVDFSRAAATASKPTQ